MDIKDKTAPRGKKPPLFLGVGTALITPFCEDGIDYSALVKLIEFQIKNGAQAIVICGTTGEAPTVTESERERMICASSEVIDGRVPLIVGTGTISTEVSLRYTAFARRHGADAVLVVTPYYNKGTRSGVVEHYRKIAEIMPTIVYNVPSRTGVDISLSQLEALTDEENVIGIKEASPSVEKCAQIKKEFGDRYALYSGNDTLTLPLLSLGGAGVISVASNVIPAQMQELCQLFFDGKTRASRELHERYFRFMQLLFTETNPTPVKYASSLLGLCENRLRLPLSVAEDSTCRLLKEEMQALGIIPSGELRRFG